ncbi:arginase family protein [Elioraea rosea]|uniref:arginase family protein n=1 Tax=Elioraea rosea TaxID=2492390 RepID=UPI00131516E3|nr:arginase family protein [Elioraea rosea]
MLIQPILLPFAGDVGRWGAAKGPGAIMEAGIALALAEAGHTLAEPVVAGLARGTRVRDQVTNIGRLAAQVSDAVAAAIGEGRFPLVLEGNCTGAVGPAGGVARAKGGCGIVWYDAHGDMHSLATTGTGLLGGMPYAVCLGWEFDDWREAAGLSRPVRAEAAALLGASDLDPEEEAALAANPIARLDAAEMGSDAAERTEALLAPRAAEAPGWYMHIDLDVAGPDNVPGALTPAPLWPARGDLIASIAAAAKAVPLACLGLAAYDPSGDPSGRGARLAIDMALAALGGDAA